MHKHAGRRDCIVYRTWSGYKLANQMVSSAVETIFLTFSNTIYSFYSYGFRILDEGPEPQANPQGKIAVVLAQCQWLFILINTYWRYNYMAPCELKLHVDLNYHTMQYTQS